MNNIFLTGCTGFLGSHILYQLCLNNTYNIYCVIRNNNNISLFKNFPNNHKIRFIISDLDTPKKYRHILIRCHYVIHTASPVILKKLNKKDEFNLLINPALNNIKNIFENVNPIIFKRFIFTSSVTAIYNKNKFCDEKDWNLNDLDSYSKSKLYSEIKCFEYVKNKPYDVVSINPSAFFGKDIIEKKSNNNKLIEKIIHNQYHPFHVNFKMTFCDVRDVAKFHILSLNKNIKKGRYIVHNRTIDVKTLLEKCNKINPNIKLPLFYINPYIVNNFCSFFRINVGELYSYLDYTPLFNNNKSKKYINYTNINSTLKKILL